MFQLKKLFQLIIYFSAYSFFVRSMFYDVTLERLEIFNETNKIIENKNLRVTKYNRSTAVASGSAELLTLIDDNYDVSVDLFYSSSGTTQYTKYPFKVDRKNICEFMNTTYREYLMEDITKVSNFPTEDNLCPLQPQLYWLKNFYFDIDNAPNGKDGMWMVHVLFWRDTDIIFGYNLICKLQTRMLVANVF